MSQEPVPKFYFESRCPQCYLMLSSARSLLNHLKSQHQIFMESRAVSQSRPRDTSFHSVSNKKEATELRLSCPSCWFHCPDNDLQSYTDHIKERHLSKPWEEYVNFSNEDLSSYRPDNSKTDEARTAQENQIMEALVSLTENFKNLFSRPK